MGTARLVQRIVIPSIAKRHAIDRAPIVVHRGVGEAFAITWPTRQFIMFFLRWFGDSFQFRMLWGYIGTKFPRTVYYYGPTVLWDNVVPLIMWMCIGDVCNFITVNCVWAPFAVPRMRERSIRRECRNRRVGHRSL